MAEKHATFNQLKMLALRGKADSAARIAELAELLVKGLEEAQHDGIVVTLPVSGWNGGVQKVQDASLLAKSDYWYFPCVDADDLTTWSESCITADNITVDGEMTFHCVVVPTKDLTVYILRLEVQT